MAREGANHGTLRGRGEAVARIVRQWCSDVVSFGETKKGQPEHPLYQPGTIEMTSWP